jgi:hypothetical protein
MSVCEEIRSEASWLRKGSILLAGKLKSHQGADFLLEIPDENGVTPDS